jgi:hypothetical protein
MKSLNFLQNVRAHQFSKNLDSLNYTSDAKHKDQEHSSFINIEEDATSSQSHTNANVIRGKYDTWKPEHNEILAEWADKAMCYRWLHFRSYQKYNRYNIAFTVPVIIISTLTGTANFAIGSTKVYYASLIIGSFNIIAGIVSTIQHFLKISELNEGHKVASLSWDKFYRNIKMELRKNPDDRMSVVHMLKIYKEEYDRLMEISPIIDDDILCAFKNAFKQSVTFAEVKKPEICNELVPTSHIVYHETTEIAVSTPIIRTIDETEDNKLKKAVDNSNLNTISSSRKIVEEFLLDFEKINDRKPLEEEIIRNLKERVEASTIAQIVKDLCIKQ